MKPWRNWYHCMASTFGHWLPGDPQGFRTRLHREHIEGDYKSPPPPGLYDARHAHSKSIMKRPPVFLPPEARTEACRRLVEALHHYQVEVIDLCITATHFHVLARFSPFDTAPQEKTLQSPPTLVGGSHSDPNPPTGVSGLSTPDDNKIIIPQIPWDELKQQIESAEGYFTDDDDEEANSQPSIPQPPPPQSPPTPVGGSPIAECPQFQAGLSPAHFRNDGLDPRPRYYIGKAKSWASRHVKSARLTPAVTQGGLFAKRGKIVPITDRNHQIQVTRYIRRHVDEGGAVYSLHLKPQADPPTGVGGLSIKPFNFNPQS